MDYLTTSGGGVFENGSPFCKNLLHAHKDATQYIVHQKVLYYSTDRQLLACRNEAHSNKNKEKKTATKLTWT